MASKQWFKSCRYPFICLLLVCVLMLVLFFFIAKSYLVIWHLREFAIFKLLCSTCFIKGRITSMYSLPYSGIVYHIRV